MLSLLGPSARRDGPPGRETAVVSLIREHLAAAGVPHQPAPMGGLMAGDLQGQAVAAGVRRRRGRTRADALRARRERHRPRVPAWPTAGCRLFRAAHPHAAREARGGAPRGRGGELNAAALELRVDLGSAEAKLGAGDGAFAVFDEPFAGEAPRVTGKALGDRPACALLADLAADDASKTLGCAFIFYAQGQLGEHGLRLALHALAPQAFVLVRGVRHAPQVDKSGSAVLAGSGPVLVLRRDASVSHPALVDACQRAAAEAGVSVQKAVLLSEKPAHPPAEPRWPASGASSLAIRSSTQDCARPYVDLRDLEALQRLLRTLVAAEFDA